MGLRRLFQFRLRTLLILATVLCLALAMIVVPARRQRQAVLELRARGADVIYAGFEGDARPFITWNQAWLGCDFRERVSIIYTNRPTERHAALSDRDWQLILICQPTTLGMFDDKENNPSLAQLKELRSLRR